MNTVVPGPSALIAEVTGPAFNGCLFLPEGAWQRNVFPAPLTLARCAVQLAAVLAISLSAVALVAKIATKTI